MPNEIEKFHKFSESYDSDNKFLQEIILQNPYWIYCTKFVLADNTSFRKLYIKYFSFIKNLYGVCDTLGIQLSLYYTFIYNLFKNYHKFGKRFCKISIN